MKITNILIYDNELTGEIPKEIQELLITKNSKKSEFYLIRISIYNKNMDNVIISIEAVGSGMNLLDIEISNELTIKELYERIQEELEIDDDFILFKEYDYDNELIISKNSIRNVYGNEKNIKLTLFNKIYTEREI